MLSDENKDNINLIHLNKDKFNNTFIDLSID